MDPDQVLAFRLARSGLAAREAHDLAAAAACPASDFARGAALLALGARADGVTRGTYAAAVDAGDLVVAHIIRGAIHAVAPRDFGLYGRALLARDDVELGAQLGPQVQRLAADKGFRVTDALAEVAAATADALAGGRALDKNALHAELRERVGPDLMPWCAGCGSHHVAPMLWRYATVQAGVRLDSSRRYLLADPGHTPAGAEAVRRFLHFYGPANAGDFADWAGLAASHARRLWDEVAGELREIRFAGGKGWIVREDLAVLLTPVTATGIRLLPPGDPFLQKPNRPLLFPDAELRKRLFRPTSGPGVVLCDGRLRGVWRIRAHGRKAELTVEQFGPLPRADLEVEAQRVAALRGAAEAVLI